MPSPTFKLKSEVVRAGAGAGKTEGLKNKVLSVAKLFFEQQNKLPRVVVTTFTKKATEELKERLLKSSLQESDENLLKFITSTSHLHISTIHGVMILFLKRYAHWLNVDPAFKFIDEMSAHKMAKSVLREILVSQTKFSALLDNFSLEKLVNELRKFALQLAIHPEIKSVSASEIRRLSELKCKLFYDNFYNSLLQVKSQVDDPKWQETAEQKILLLKSFSNANAKYDFWPEIYESLKETKWPRRNSKKIVISEDLYDSLIDAEDDFLNLLENHEVFSRSEEFNQLAELFLQLARLFVENFANKKKDSGVCEMSDLEAITLQCIRNHPEMAKAFSADWDYWLIDEFQDTSPLQLEILKEFVNEKSKYVVGDPQQSIYLFRGAQSEVFESAMRETLATGGEISELLKNYRSNPSLLIFFNDFFEMFNTPEQIKFVKMQPRSEPTAKSEVIAKFCILQAAHSDRYQPIAEEILSAYKLQNRPFQNNCILARTHSELKDIALYLESLNIPVHLHAAKGFYNRREVLDSLSILKFLVNPMDNVNLVRLLRSPWYKISDSELINSLTDRPQSIWHALCEKIPQHAIIIKLRQMRESVLKQGIYETLVDEIKTNGMVDLSAWHDSSGRREANIWKFLFLLKEKEKTPGFNYLSFIQSAFHSIEQEDADSESDATAVLEPHRVNLMTVHGSKGLKFKNVFVPNLHKTLQTSSQLSHRYPTVVDPINGYFSISLQMQETKKMVHNEWSKSILSKQSLLEEDEQLRVLYVALTRAEESVFLHWCEPVKKGSLASRISMNLTEGKHSTSSYSYEVVRPNPAQSVPNSLQLKKSDVREIHTAKSFGPVRLQRFSVSELLSDNKTVESSTNVKNRTTSTELLKHIEAPIFGKKLHELFEKLKYVNNQNVEEFSRKWFAKSHTSFKEAYDYVLKLEDPPVMSVIQNGHVEWGFQLKTKKGVLEGQVDLWGDVQNKNGEVTTWVIDYKSGSSRFLDKTFQQMNLYSLALRESGLAKNVMLAAIYAVEKKVIVQPADEIQTIKSHFNL